MNKYLDLIEPIRTDREYKAALAFIDRHVFAKHGTLEARLVKC
jgi:antitoxin component HigA of HigAB toxin-antitoxin module